MDKEEFRVNVFLAAIKGACSNPDDWLPHNMVLFCSKVADKSVKAFYLEGGEVIEATHNPPCLPNGTRHTEGVE